MANYATLKAAIAAAIKQNGNNEITGNLLQQQLLAMVNSLGVGYQYAGIAIPETNPGTPDQNVFYLASTAGTYANFDGLALADGEIAILKYNGAWSKDSTGAATSLSVEKLQHDINGKYIPIPQSAIVGSLTSDGQIVTDYGLCHAMLNVSLFRGAHITIKSTLNPFQYAFLKSYTSNNVVFCDNCTRVTGYPTNVLIPDDANYMYILCGDYTNPTFPYSITTDVDDAGVLEKVNVLTKISRKLKIRSVVDGGQSAGAYKYEILIPTFDGNTYFKTELKHVVIPAKNADNWRMYCGYLSDGENNIAQIITDGEWEMAVQLVGRPDFIGGGLHGNELVQSLTCIIDGRIVGSPLEPVGTFVECDEIRFIEITNLYDPSNPSTQVATHRKYYSFTKDGLRLKQRIVWLGSYDLTYSYLCMFPVGRILNNRQITNLYNDDKNYIIYNVAQPNFGGYPITMRPGVMGQYLYGNELGLSMSAEIKEFSPEIANRISFLSDSEYYNKMYFDFCGNSYSVNNGDVWKTDVIYKVNKTQI